MPEMDERIRQELALNRERKAVERSNAGKVLRKLAAGSDSQRCVRTLNKMHRPLWLAISVALLSGCSGVCENEIFQTVVSPSGNMKAVVFNRGCGATVGFNTQVSRLPASARLPNSGGNVLVVDDTVPLKLEWESDTAVRITGRLDTQIFKKEAAVSGIQVAYAN